MITYSDKTKVFALQTKNSVYQMQVEEHGFLLHLYYGKTVGDCAITHRIIKKDRGFSGNPGDGVGDRTISLDTLPLEYSGFGNGDYRTASIEIIQEDGSNIIDLRYASHTICKGIHAQVGLPSLYAQEEQGETLIITLHDTASDVYVDLHYGVIWDRDVITRSVTVRNQGSTVVSMRRVMSMQIDFPDCNMDFMHFYGRHCMERLTERQSLHHGVQSIGSTRGMSSHHHNPFLILCDKTATENYGNCYGMTFLYSGNFLAELEVDQMDQTRVVFGIHSGNFEWILESGQQFTAPQIMLTYSDRGLNELSMIQHEIIRNHLIRGKYAKKRRPILVNNWEATYFDFTDEKLLRIAKEAKQVGIEMLVMDDGWFGKRDDDNSGLGDWYVNTEKLKGGLPALVEKVNQLGLEFGIWVEPEMISEDSQLYREHPEWALKIKNRQPNRSRNQLNLDITREEVRDYIMKALFAVLDSSNIRYVKWDMNRSLANVFSAALPSEKQGQVIHRYVLGLYDMLEQFVKRYPDILLETCSGGGGRFDAGMLYYSPQIWCSDDTDAIERLKIQYGTSFAYPISTMGSHVSACPNHQTGRITPFETRGIVAMAGTFGYELDLEHLTQEEKALTKLQIEAYKKIAPLVLTGRYYRLNNPFEADTYVAWQFVSQDQHTAFVGMVQLRAEANGSVKILKMEGLDEAKKYRINDQAEVYTGAALMYAGISIIEKQGDYQSTQLYIQSIV